MPSGPAGFAELVGGVDGDPAPEPQVVLGPVSDLAHDASPLAPVTPEGPAAETDAPVAVAVAALSWQQQVDTQRADFGLTPIAESVAGPPLSPTATSPPETTPGVPDARQHAPSLDRIRALAARRRGA